MNITVLGVGNTIMKDDAFGIRVIERLNETHNYANVKVLDGGTLGMGLMPFLTGTQRLLIVDAINAPGEAGDYFTFEGEALAAYFSNKISVHDLGLNDLLAVLDVTDNPVEKTMVIGVKPQEVDLGIDMSEKVREQIEPTVEKVIEIINSWGAQEIPFGEKGANDQDIF